MRGADPHRQKAQGFCSTRPTAPATAPALSSATRPGRPDEIHLSSLALVPFDHLTLMLMRWHFQTFAQPESHGWLMALRVASAHVGPRAAGALCADLVAVVQVLRTERTSAFRFNPQGCACCREWATPEERRIMDTIGALRDGQLGRARTTVQMLCDGVPSDSFIMAIQSYLSRHDPKPARQNGPVPSTK